MVEGAVIEVIEPATERVMATVPRAGAAEVDAAVARAKAAFPAWRAVGPAERAALMRGLADAIEAEAEALGLLEARNAGKPIGDARGEIGMVVEFLTARSESIHKLDRGRKVGELDRPRQLLDIAGPAGMQLGESGRNRRLIQSRDGHPANRSRAV